ncbi:MAG: DUF3828 domain-containing protein [Candidatus Eremiobacteraeota bacterium]|nr:DUF3828 domain-containing protein [Candidatus Eremiobacteraeota bacterium]
MKRMLACIFLAGAVLFATAPIPAQTGGSSATATLRKFYVWYLRQPSHEWTRHFSQIKAVFDPNLYTMLVTVLHSKANQREPIIDFDPFVNAQWDAASYALGAPTTKGGNVQVPVTLNLSGRPNAKTKLTAVLRKNASGSYVIYNLIYDPKFNLRDFLSKQLKK